VCVWAGKIGSSPDAHTHTKAAVYIDIKLFCAAEKRKIALAVACGLLSPSLSLSLMYLLFHLISENKY